MSRRLLVPTFFSTLITGCTGSLGTILADEEFVVGAWNPSGQELEQVRVIDVSNPKRWWFSQSGQPPHPAWPNVPPAHIPAFGGDRRSGRIPDAVTVQWRDLPPPGGKPYTGKLHGPFLVTQIRSRIPSDVLRKARQEGYSLQISFSSGVEPVLFNWMLEHFGSRGEGLKEIARGGDSVK